MSERRKVTRVARQPLHRIATQCAADPREPPKLDTRLRPCGMPAHDRPMASSFTSLCTFSRALASLAAVVVVLVVSPATAQQALVIIDDAPSCEALQPCTAPGTVCTGPLGGVCTALSYAEGGTVKACIAPDVVYCCATGADCPLLVGTPAGACVGPRTGDLTFGHGLCSYGPWESCLAAFDGTDAELVQACFEPAVGSGSAPYGIVPFALGDCDGDDTPNGTDPCVCDNSATCEMSGIDGGMTNTDAGAGPDAGSDTDAGANSIDAGELPPFDLGTRDVDANLPPGAGLDFRGDGGCVCEAGGVRATGTSGSAALLLTLSGLFALARRRRHARIEAKADRRV